MKYYRISGNTFVATLQIQEIQLYDPSLTLTRGLGANLKVFLKSQSMVSYYLLKHSTAVNAKTREICDLLQIASACIQQTKDIRFG